MVIPGKREVGKSGVYIYIETTIALASGYFLWLILSKIATADIIGTASTAISISSIVTTVVTLGIPNSISRFLGKSFIERRIQWARLYIISSLIIVSVAVGVACIALVMFWDVGLFGSLSWDMVMVILIFTCASAIALVLRYSVIASLQTKTLVLRESIYSSAKIVISVILVMSGLGSVGITTGYAVSQILAVILLASVVSRIYKRLQEDSDRMKITIKFKSTAKEVLRAGFPSWIPALVTITGTQLGTIVVFGSQGAHDAGAYFIAFSISNGITTLTYSLLSSTFPALSAMKDGRKKFAWQLTKISLIITVPLSLSLIFYTTEIMSIFGASYISGSWALKIFLMSILPTTVITGFNILVYAYGDYRKVLLIGLATSLPRTFLYFILVPLYGIEGSAISFSLGSLIGFVICIIMARKIGMRIYWKDLLLIWALPLTIALVLHAFDVYSILAIALTIFSTYFLLVKFGTISKTDIRDFITIVPPNISMPIIKVLNKLGKRLNRR